MLRRYILISGIWSYCNYFLKGIFAISLALIFSRFIDIKLYGYFVLGDLIINFLSNFGEIGLSNYLINRKNIDDKVFATSFSLTLLFSIFLVFLINFILVINNYINNYLYIFIIIKYLSFMIPAKNLVLIINSKWSRDLNNKLIAKVSIFSEIISFTSALIILNKFGALSALLAYTIFKPWLKLLISFNIQDYRFRFFIDLGLMKEIINFGLPLTFSRLVTYLNFQAPKMVCGIFLGPYLLGLLSAANLIIQTIHNLFNATMWYIWIPFLGKIKRELPKRFGEFYIRIRNIQAAVNIPIFLLIFSLKNPIVNILLPKRFNEIENLLPVLCLSAILLSTNYLFQPILILLGETKQRLLYDIVKCIMLFSILIPLSYKGINFLLYSTLIIDLILFVFSQYYLKSKIKLNVFIQINTLKTILISSIPILFSPLLIKFLYLKINFYSLFGIVFFNIFLYILLIYFLDKKLFSDLNKFKIIFT